MTELVSIRREWRKLVGPQVADVAAPIDLWPDRTLLVSTKTPEWRRELTKDAAKLARTIGVPRVVVVHSGAPLFVVRP